MRFEVWSLHIPKRFPLAISRGVNAGAVAIFLRAHAEGLTGLGECSPGTSDVGLQDRAVDQLTRFTSEPRSDWSPWSVWRDAHAWGMEEAPLAALDMALWDLLAKRAGLPLHVLLGLPKPTVATSVTIGINPVEVIRERVPEMLRLWPTKSLKIKLGSPKGEDHDRESYEASREAARPFGVSLRVDANGGWSPETANRMIPWLADRECDYVEQPLVKGAEEELPGVFRSRKLPIYLDESIRLSQDVAAWADRCDGVNLKLMKTGGVTEALRVVATARAHGLKTMIGCMSDSSIAIAAGAHLGALFDHIDLDSHLNLMPDPAQGLDLVDGVVMPSSRPGLGVEWVG